MGRALEGRQLDLAVFPELFLSGYRVGDRTHRLALSPGDPVATELAKLARSRGTHLLVGGPIEGPRPGETSNAAIWATPEGEMRFQVKRYLPSYGPFEEGHFFTPTDRSAPVPFGRHAVGLAICYDTFFPEVFRGLAVDGADLMAIISASPVTSRRLFEKLLPARAVENGCPVLYVNRVGVEDGIVFGGGTGAWDVRGEPIELRAGPMPGGASEELLFEGDVDLTEATRWRPFRPVLRDHSMRRQGVESHGPEPSEPIRRPAGRPGSSGRRRSTHSPKSS
jgi:predicted amidohydrolase